METPDAEDPFDWNVDQVVAALCNRRASWTKSTSFNPLPEAKRFEQALRDNRIDGCMLLTQVDQASARDDLGLKALGERGTIMHAVRNLRGRSQKYNEYIQETASHIPLPGSSVWTDPGLLSHHGFGSPFYGSPAFTVPAVPSIQNGSRPSPIVSPTRPVALMEASNISQAKPGYDTWSEAFVHTPKLARPDQRQFVEEPRIDVPESPLSANETRQQLSPMQTPTANLWHTHELKTKEGPEPINATSQSQVEDTNHRPGETYIIDESGRKRRKLTLVPIDSDLNIHFGTDDAGLIAENNRSLQTSPKAGQITIDPNGRKRVKPILVSQSAVGIINGTSSEPYASPNSPPYNGDHVQEVEKVDRNKNIRDSSRNSRLAYLGSKAYPVDEVFYAKTMVGEEVNNDVHYNTPVETHRNSESDTFLVSSASESPNGQRLYVHGLMKHFLATSERRNFSRNGQSFTAIFPYPERVGRKHLNPSFTLFSHTTSGIRATREDRTKWSAAFHTTAPRSLNQTDQDSAVTHFSVPDDDPFSLTESQNENRDWDFLEKWRYVDQGEKLLPIYGDSGSEGEYDLDTWREIEDERGTIQRPAGRSSRKQLTQDEVSNAIDQGIDDLEAKWRTQILPLKESKAWRLWTKSRRDRSKHQQIEIATSRIVYLNDVRLPKMRKEITSEVWSNVVQVKKQCRILEETVFEREDQNWRISTLQLRSAPSKPPHKGNARPVKVPSIHESLGDDEEILTSETETVESSENGLDGFIIDDSDTHERFSGVADQITSDVDRVQDGDNEHIVGLGDNDTSSEDDIVAPTLRRRRHERGETSPSPELNGTSHSRLGSDLGNPRTHALHHGQPEPLSILSSARSMPDPFTSTPLGARDMRKPIKLENVIDLTISSDLPDAPSPGYKSDPYFSIRTPPLNPQDDNPFRDKNKPRAEFRDPPMHSSVINLESESSPTLEEDTFFEKPDELPDLSEVEKISRLKPSFLVERQDRKRQLIRYIHKLSPQERQGIVARTIAATLKESQFDVWNGLHAIKGHARKIRGAETRTSDDIMRISQLYICWSQNTKHSTNGYPKNWVEKTIEDVAGFECFYTFLCDRLARYESEIVEEPIVIDSTPEKSIRGPGKRKLGGSFAARLQQDESDDLLGQRTPHKKRKNIVQESVEARHLRYNDQQRVQDQERRRTQLMRLQRTVMRDGETPSMIVNVSKFEHQDLIHLNAGIATKIKPHQLEGVQFMWRELVTDERSLQGCLLAHTMGLGKTMQVITLLVTIAESAKSQNRNIQDQIPLSLNESRTLILCPPSLVDNWWDEFLIWAPVPMENNVGQLRKVVSGSKSRERLHEISAWYNDGGVLIISYDLFRHYVHNKSTKSRGPPLNEEQHAKVRKELLEGPNIIVADEAHKMKNISSATTSAANLFRSKSRIALTGSPLANNLEEYFAMINWIAPGYLGDIVQFRARYAEPIQEGLYQNSASYEKRQCLKMLQVLKRDLDPKINRADITVLKGSLKAKTEFVIKVPLTKLQDDAYRLYVRSMLGDTGDDEPGNARLWDWLAILSLLCNHPLCFRNKLLEREAAAQQSAEAATIKARQRAAQEGAVNSDDELLPGDEVVSKLGVSQATIEKQLALFDNVPVALDSISHSHKVEIFNQILDASIAAHDKVLVFSHSIPTLNYLEDLFKQTGRKYARLDGKTKMSDRQKLTKDFNSGKAHVCLISTRAGGLGLNLPGANRVIIFDFGFNPIWEEQAVGRAYRIGQEKPVFVYRFTAGGTFEDKLHNQAVFKTQLASRVVDKKNPTRFAIKGVRQYLFEPKPVVQKDLSSFLGKDPLVLDGILASENSIRSIELTETFHQEDNDKLTAEEEKEAEQILKDEQLKRTNPAAYRAIVNARDQAHFINRYQTAKGSAMPMAQSHMQLPSQPLETLQNPLLAKVNQGIKNSAAKIHSHTLGYPNLPLVAGTSTKVHERVLGATAYKTLAQGSLPHPSLSEHPDQSNQMDPGYPAEGREGAHTGTPAQAAEPPHVGEAPFTTSSHASSSSAKDTLQTKGPSGGGTRTQIPSQATVDTPPSRVTPTPTVTPSVAAPVDWVTEAELVASIPPEGIRPTQLIPMFQGRIRNEEELLDWMTACAKWDPLTNILWPRPPSQRAPNETS